MIRLVPFLTLLLAAPPATDSQVQQLELVRNKSILVDTPAALKRTSITNPEIANLVVVSPRQILLNGNRTGTTNLIVWLESGGTTIFNITVSVDTDLIKRRLDDLLPRNRIEVSGAGNLVILSGEVNDIADIEHAQAIAESLTHEVDSKKAGATADGGAPGTVSALAGADSKPVSNVVNLLRVASLQQVQLEVTVAEVDRQAVREMGLNAQYAGFDIFGLSNIGQVIPPAGPVSPPGRGAGAEPHFTLSNAVGVMFGIPKYDVTGFVRALKQNGMVRILAEPSLVTVSGEKASFLAGGEFPVPVQQSQNSISVEFREFGIRLSFTPTVLGSNRISLKVQPEVSSLDFNTAVQVGTFSIPGLKTRRADTSVELESGQSFAIAGLISDEMTSEVAKFPVLGEIPILGALFRSTRFRRQETELLIVVTPRLVRPLDVGKRPDLPVDRLRPPTDFELFLLGKTFGKTDAMPVGPWGFEK